MKVFLRFFTMVYQVITRSHKFFFQCCLQRMNFSYLTIRLFARDFYRVVFDKSPNEQSRIEIESELSISCFFDINPLTPMSDQDRISPYNINTISSRQLMRITKNVDKGIIS